MIEHLIGIFAFLFYCLGFITLSYGISRRNKYVRIYSFLTAIWSILIGLGSLEIFGIVIYRLVASFELTMLLLILPMVPIWLFYFTKGEHELRAKEEQEYRDRMGIGKTDEEHWEYLIKKGVVTPEYLINTSGGVVTPEEWEYLIKKGVVTPEHYKRWQMKEGIIKPPPLTKEELRQMALEEERRKKEAKKEAEKIAKGLTERELIDRYIELDVAGEAVGFGPEGVGVEGWNAINDELKYRNISSRRIEKRRKELEQKGLKERYQGLPKERLIDDYIWWLIKIDVGDAKPEGAEFDSMCDEIKRRGITDKQIKKRRKKLRKHEETYKKQRNAEMRKKDKLKDKLIDHELTWEEYKKKHYGKKQK